MKPGDLAINQAAGRVGVGAGCLVGVSQRGGRGDGGWMLDLELAIWWRGGGDETFFAPTRSSKFFCLILGQFF